MTMGSALAKSVYFRALLSALLLVAARTAGANRL